MFAKPRFSSNHEAVRHRDALSGTGEKTPKKAEAVFGEPPWDPS